MITANFPIRFNFLADSARLNIILEADVQEHHSEVFYEVRNFRVPGHVRRIVLPEIKIRKENGQWVHTDSGQATDLSVAVGKGIEAQAGNAIEAQVGKVDDSPPTL
jgi:hypothetical protein